MAASEAVAVDALARVFPAAAGRAIAVLICISALGAVNGLIFTGARISYALGAGHLVFRPLGNMASKSRHPGLGLDNSGCFKPGHYPSGRLLSRHYYLYGTGGLAVFPGHGLVCFCPATARTGT